jgi:tRNA(Ile)-lysidine synthetase-like protein
MFAEDRGNAYPGYARTALREVVLPAWEAALPGAVEAAARAAAVAAEMEQLAQTLLADAERRVRLTAGSAAAGGGRAGGGDAARGGDPADGAHAATTLSVSALRGLEPSLRRLLLRRWLEGRASRLLRSDEGFAFQQPARPAASRASVLALESLLQIPGSAARNLGGGCRGVKEYDELSLVAGVRPMKAPPAPAPARLTVPGRIRWGDVWIGAEPAERFMAPDVSREAFVDARSVAGELQIRGPQPGDRVRPLGAAGARKLQDVLVDMRIPAAARPTTPLLVCDGRVVWVCGMLVAEEGRITRETTGIVRLALGLAEEGDGQR